VVYLLWAIELRATCLSTLVNFSGLPDGVQRRM
jgi:hypothetical protein